MVMSPGSRGIKARVPKLSGLATAKSQRFSYAISQIASLPPVVALHRKLQLDTLRFGAQFPKSHWPAF